jgi:hypothetical protein
VRRATLATICCLAVAVALAACTDLREYRGQWHGPRVGSAAVLDVGVTTDARAALEIDTLDPHGLAGVLSVDGIVVAAPVASLPGAEADALSGLTFAGAPLRVYLAFVDTSDGGGQALAVIALFEDRRVEVRLLRGGSAPLYGVFALAEDVEGAGSAS